MVHPRTTREDDPMFSLRLPTPNALDSFVRKVSGCAYNTPLGVAGSGAPAGWLVDDVDAIVGMGNAAFDAATAAIRAWSHLELGWFRVHRPEQTPLEPGVVVAYSTRIARVWMTFACRIVSVIDDVDADGTRRFGYVYATIGNHAAKGEERVLVTLNPSTGEVHGSIRAVSRPARWYTWVGLPVARRAQRLFKPEALAALAAAVRRQVGQDLSTNPR